MYIYKLPYMECATSRKLETTPTSSEGHNEQEMRLVDEITAPGGVRTAPTREAMTSFISR